MNKMNSPAFRAEIKRLQALQDRRTLVHAAAVVQDVFAQHLRQGRMILLTTAGERRRCAFIRPGITRLLMQVRCGIVAEAALRDKSLDWFRKGHPARSKARQMSTGFVTAPNDCGRKPAKWRQCHGDRS